MRNPILILAAVACAFAQTGSRVEGRLVDASTGEPVRKGWVTLRPANGQGTGYTAVSDSNGTFVLEGVEPGRYALSVEHSSYLKLNQSRAVTVTGGQTQSAGRIALHSQSVISGRVTDEDGDPFPSGVQVQVSRWQWDFQTGQRTLTQIKQTTPDDQGNFRIAGLAPGLYYLSGYGSRTSAAFDDRTVVRTGEAYGLTYYPSSPTPNGASPVEAPGGGEVRGVNLRLRKSHVARIRGTVRDAATGGPVNQVALVLIAQGTYPTRPVTNDAVSVVQNGVFEFARVTPGNYTILTGDTTGTGKPVGRYDLSVGDSNVENVLLELNAGATVEGHFKMENGDPLPANVSFAVRAADATRVRMTARADGKEGVLHLSGLLPGRYWIDTAGRLSPETYVKSIRLGDVDVTYKPVDIANGVAPPLEILLSGKAGTLTGPVRNEKSEPVSAAQVVLAPASADLADVQRLTQLFSSGADGQFRAGSLAPGDYLILAAEQGDAGQLRDPQVRAALASHGVRVTVQEGSRLNSDIPVISAQALSEALAKLP